MVDERTLAHDLTERMAGANLTRSIARLYSQHTLLKSGNAGLRKWESAEAEERLNDAVRLIQAGLIEKEEGTAGWERAFRRAAEIFEWLSHPDMVDIDVPTRLLSAACYQLAGYPARAAGIINESADDEDSDSVIGALLRHDFEKVHRLLNLYWSSRESRLPRTSVDFTDIEEFAEEQLFEWLQEQLCGIVGILNASLRWGFDERLGVAMRKLSALCRVLLHSRHVYSWLLAELVYISIQENVGSSLRDKVSGLTETITADGQVAFERYLRFQYLNKRVTAWPSQILGINRLVESKSFALCTPTGSGKTLVAELAILRSLFGPTAITGDDNDVLDLKTPLVLYLVPSRALATEVEGKLSRVVKGLGDQEIIVTGLYGGTDWGPTDAWLTSGQKTVVICTYEKAEALIRFVGRWLIERLRLVIIDEAHSVCFKGSVASLHTTDALSIDRALRLESLGSRLLTFIDRDNCDVIALSAVAQGAEEALAQWISSSAEVGPSITKYRSTRQLIGRLECFEDRRLKIEYDLLDGAPLELSSDTGEKRPYIPNPFERCPPAPDFTDEGAEKALRPFLFWAAINFAAPDQHGRKHATLVSVTQNIYGHAQDFLELLETTWSLQNVPVFFIEPKPDDSTFDLYSKVLDSCDDYFGKTSLEYRLLKRGVVIHHGQMPGLLSRLLVEAIESRVFSLVLATSTLSEGVNLPFETILIPTLRRIQDTMSPAEFRNLAGRAGRPGSGTEGRTLLVLGELDLFTSKKARYSANKARDDYFSLISQLSKDEVAGTTQAPIAELLSLILSKWRTISGSSSIEDFLQWLEAVNPLDPNPNPSHLEVIGAVDNLDGVLLASIAELEQQHEAPLDLTDLEDSLKIIWQHTFSAFAAERNSERLSKIFVHRGCALLQVYKDRNHRRQLYRTGLPPRSAQSLLDRYSDLRDQLRTGHEYHLWSDKEKVEYLKACIGILSEITPFALPELKENRRKPPYRQWQEVLEWWMKTLARNQWPKPEKLDDWHKYVRTYFINRASWGVGAVIALVADEMLGEQTQPLDIKEWRKLDLPWVVFWFKELLTWGTLDPVAAYVLSRNLAITRGAAHALASEYYQEKTVDSPHADLLDPKLISDWVDRQTTGSGVDRSLRSDISVRLVRDFSKYTGGPIRVLPVRRGDEINWVDPAGYLLASSFDDERTEIYFGSFDFMLDPKKAKVNAKPYL